MAALTRLGKIVNENKIKPYQYRVVCVFVCMSVCMFPMLNKYYKFRCSCSISFFIINNENDHFSLFNSKNVSYYMFLVSYYFP